jgi:peptide methionine sulfoxide reductase MsrA
LSGSHTQASGFAGGQVTKVTRGFRGFHEINTVTYDPRLISIQNIAAALKSAGTYLGQADD